MWKVNQFEAVLKALLAGALKTVSGGLQVVVSVLNLVCPPFFFLSSSSGWAEILERGCKFPFQGNCFCLVETSRFSAVIGWGQGAVKGGFQHSCL